MELAINAKYKLAPLLRIEKDNISHLFKDNRGVYICDFPDQEWYEYHRFIRSSNYSIEKKLKFFELMDEKAVILSPTQDPIIQKPTMTFKSGNVVHFGSRFTGRLAQISMAVQIIFWLIKNRNVFDYCLYYNFYPGEMISAFIAKHFLGKRIIIDFEDDYIHLSSKVFYNFYFNLVKRIPHVIICINRKMFSHFNNQELYVFNGFINLNYTRDFTFNLEEGNKFLYSGALDEIRGIDLIPEIVKTLRKKLKRFSIYITGNGPYIDLVKNWKFKEVTYLGFLSSVEYNNIIAEVDFCLVLQKPDHPFSQGSFPSKVEAYSKFKKPIFYLETRQT